MTITIFGFDDEILDDYEVPSRKALNGFIPAIRRVARKSKGRPAYGEGCFLDLWKECIRDLDTASRDLYMLGYDFLLLGTRLLDIEKVRDGDTLTAMLVVLKNGTPVNPFQDYRTVGILRSVEEFTCFTDNIYSRTAKWNRGADSGRLLLYAYTAFYGGKDIDLDERDPWIPMVPGAFGRVAHVLELSGHYEQLTNIGTVQRILRPLDGRLCIWIDCQCMFVIR